MDEKAAGCNYNRTQILNKQLSDGRRLIRCRNFRGDARMEIHPVFPGVRLAFVEAHTDRCPTGIADDPSRLELHYCTEGRIQRRHGEHFLCLTPGDAVMICPGTGAEDLSFPLCHYHGISVIFDRRQILHSFAEFLDGVEVSLENLAQRFCGGHGYCIFRRQSSLQKIFADLCTPPIRGRKGFLQVKLLELLLALDALEPTEKQKQIMMLSKAQIELARETALYLSENMDKRITAEQLAQHFHVSQTSLRNAFKSVYGMPIYSYIRFQKMNQAALLLIRSDRSIQEIANSSGYDNASKFSAAFREIMGESPLDYRKSHA